jgi:hypothetical protein
VSGRPTPAQVATLARAVAAAALVLAATSRGELAVLGLLLLVPDALRRGVALRAVAVAGAVFASSWRWGTTSLEALAGVQAVLGPAGGIGPAAGATGSWLAAIALVLALGRGRDPVRVAAVGATAAAILAGPASGGEVPVRVAVAVGATAAGLALAWWRADRPRLDRGLGLLAALTGVGAVVAVGVAGPSGAPTLPWGLVGQGVAIAAAVAAVGLLAGSPTVRDPVSALRPTSRHR